MKYADYNDYVHAVSANGDDDDVQALFFLNNEARQGRGTPQREVCGG